MGPRLTAPPGTTEIDARGAWVVPGLIDVHVHLDTPMVFQVSDEERAKILDHNPRAFLYNGVTTVLNVSSAPEWIFDLKAKQRDGRVLAPRIFATGRSITPDGGWGSRHGGALTDAASTRAAVKRYLEMGADAIKIIVEDGLGHRAPTRRSRMTCSARPPKRPRRRACLWSCTRSICTSTSGRSSIRPRAIIHGLEDPIPSGDPVIAELKAGNVFVAPTLSLWEAFNSHERHPERFDDPVLHGSVLPFLLSSMRRPEYRAVEKKRFLEVARMDAYAWADTPYENLHGQHAGHAQGGREDRRGHRRGRPSGL